MMIDISSLCGLNETQTLLLCLGENVRDLFYLNPQMFHGLSLEQGSLKDSNYTEEIPYTLVDRQLMCFRSLYGVATRVRCVFYIVLELY